MLNKRAMRRAGWYGSLPGTAGNYFSTPDSVANSITGDIDIRVYVAMTDWTPAAFSSLIAHYTTVGDQRGYLFAVNTDGTLVIYWTTDGAAGTQSNLTSTVAPTISNGVALWVRVTLDVDNGAAGKTAKFYTSPDGFTWTQLGADATAAGTTSIFNANALLEVGSNSTGSAQQLAGSVYQAQIFSGIGGTLAATFNPNEWTSGTTWVSSVTGETWTINGTASVTHA